MLRNKPVDLMVCLSYGISLLICPVFGSGRICLHVLCSSAALIHLSIDSGYFELRKALFILGDYSYSYILFILGD